MDIGIYYLLATVAVLLLICVILLVRMNSAFSRQERDNDRIYQEIARSRQETVENMDRRLSDMNSRISNMAVENEKQLDRIRNTVDEKLQSTLEDRISKSFKIVSDRLEAVYKGLGEMQTLAAGVGDLKKVLSNVKSRGILGEVQLKAILDNILTPEQYDENVATYPGATERVEFAVRLPGDGDRIVYLPIDAKFPLDRYQRLEDAYETGERAMIDEAAKQLEKFILDSAQTIRAKYIKVPYTTDFGILFLPTEGLYAEAVRRGMIEVLQQKYRINLAGPSTMAALLNSLQMGFRTLAIEKHSSEVWEILGAVKTEFGKFENSLKKAQEKINAANNELDILIGTRTNVMNRKLRSIEELPELRAQEILDNDRGNY